jgi:hypothetical protein
VEKTGRQARPDRRTQQLDRARAGAGSKRRRLVGHQITHARMVEPDLKTEATLPFQVHSDRTLVGFTHRHLPRRRCGAHRIDTPAIPAPSERDPMLTHASCRQDRAQRAAPQPAGIRTPSTRWISAGAPVVRPVPASEAVRPPL